MVTTGNICRAKLQSNHNHQQTNIQFFYRPDALPVAQPTVLKHWTENITSHGLAYPNSSEGLPTLSLTTNSSWLPWGRVALPLISPLMPVLLMVTEITCKWCAASSEFRLSPWLSPCLLLQWISVWFDTRVPAYLGCPGWLFNVVVAVNTWCQNKQITWNMTKISSYRIFCLSAPTAAQSRWHIQRRCRRKVLALDAAGKTSHLRCDTWYTTTVCHGLPYSQDEG